MSATIKMTFAARLALIKSEADLENQITLARDYVKRLRAKAVACPTLAESLAVHEQVKAAEQVCRTLRLRSFDIEDELRDKGSLAGFAV